MTGFGNDERDNVRLREYLERNPHHSPQAYKDYTRNMSDLTPRMSESDFLASRNVENLSIGPSSIPLPEGMMIAQGFIDTPTPETVTAEAERLVCGRRGPDYGHPLDNHTATAEMWSAYMRRKYGVKIELDADDVCWMNIFQKASRDANAPKRDNLTDTAGYALNIDMIRTERDRRGNLSPP